MDKQKNMKGYRFFGLIGLLLCTQFSFAQGNRKEERAVKATIKRFFEGMETGDTSLLLSTCTSTPVFQTYMAKKSGELVLHTEDFSDFVAFIGSNTQDKFKERIKFEAVHVEESLASVWTPYSFYLNGKLSHTGTNSFQLVKMADGWKIQYIIDTRRK